MWKEFLYHRTHRRLKGHERRATDSILHSLRPFGDETEEEFDDVLSKPRKMHYKSIWKVHQDAIYWTNLGWAQEKLQFWQTRSHAITHYDSVPADGIEKVVCLQGDKTLYQRIPTPRPPPKIVQKDAW